MTNKRLYLDSWGYNTALILQELEAIVLRNGGAIVSTWKTTARETVMITNRSLDEAIQKQRKFISNLEAFGRNTDVAMKELLKLEEIGNEPIEAYYGDWHYICFTIGGKYYYYSIDDNPFFDFHYTKCDVVNGMVSPDYYSRKDNQKWMKDCFLSFYCTQEERRKAAEEIFNMLLKSKDSEKYNGNRRPEKLHVLA